MISFNSTFEIKYVLMKSKFKASITWDQTCCHIHHNYNTYACVHLDNLRDYNLAIVILIS
jgi:hypothetical protein